MRFKRVLIGIPLALVVAVGALVMWYRLVYLPPRFSPADPAALAALATDAAVRVRDEAWITLTPWVNAAALGMIFYPGGEVAPEGYAEPLRRVAAAGYTVVIVRMPLDLAVLAPNRAEAVMAAHPEIASWVICGHSLGGAMAARFVFSHPGRMAGLLLWDAYPADTDDLSSASLPVMQIYRVGPDGQPPAAYRASRHLLPAQTERVPIPGASHMNYGRFISSERMRNMGDGVTGASLPIEEQHGRITQASLEFLGRVARAAAGEAGRS